MPSVNAGDPREPDRLPLLDDGILPVLADAAICFAPFRHLSRHRSTRPIAGTGPESGIEAIVLSRSTPTVERPADGHAWGRLRCGEVDKGCATV